MRAFIAMGSVVLAVTGAEALYADMGHFGRKPIRVSWLYFVLPALLLNYMGQGAMLLSADPRDGARQGQGPVLLSRARHAAPAAGAPRDGGDDHRQPGGDLGRLLGHPAGDPARLRPAAEDHAHQRGAAGQIYIPVINWALMMMVILLVLTFRSSSNLAAAYGIAVTGAMLIDSVLIAVVLRQMWNWNRYVVAGAARALLRGRLRLSRRRTCSRSPPAAGSRCWSARSPSPSSPPGRRAAS